MKALKIILIVFLSLILLISLALLFMQTNLFREHVRKILVEEANKNLDAEVKIGELRGNFLSHIGLYDIQIKQDDAIVMLIDNLEIKYRLLNLLKKEIFIRSLLINVDVLNLVEVDEGEWNIQSLFDSATDREIDESDKTTSPWSFVLSEFDLQLDEISIHAYDPQSGYPTYIRDLKLRAAVKFSEESVFDITHFSFDSDLIDTNNLTANITMSDDIIEIAKLSLRTNQSDILIIGQAALTEFPSADINIRAQPLALSEIADALDLNMQGMPHIDISLAYRDDDLDFEIDITENIQSIVLNGRVSDLTDKPAYSLSAHTNNLNLGYWLKDDTLISSLNTTLELEGDGTDLEHINAKFNLRLDESTFGEYSIDQLKFNGTKVNDTLESELEISGEFGSAHASLALDSLFDRLNYIIDLDLSKIDLAAILQDDSFISDLNLTASAEGSGFDLDEMDTSLILEASPSSFGDYSIDDLVCRLDYRGRHLYLEHVELVSDEISVLASGEGSLEEYTVDYNISIGDLAALPMFELPFFIEETNLYGSVRYREGNYHINSDLIAENMSYEEIAVHQLASQIEASIENEIINIALDMNAVNPTIENIAIGDIDLKTNVSLEDMNYQLHKFTIENKNLTFNVIGSGHLEEDHELQIDSEIYSVPVFTGFQEISIRGKLGAHFIGNPEDFDLTADFEFDELVFEDMNIEKLSGNTSIEKRADKFFGDIIVKADNIENEDFSVDLLTLNSKLEENHLDVELSANQKNNRFDLTGRYSYGNYQKIELEKLDILISDQYWQLAKTPVSIDIDGEVVSIDSLYLSSQDQFVYLDGLLDLKGENDLRLQINGFDLALVGELMQTEFPLRGIIDFSLDLHGTASAPRFDLLLSLEDGGNQNISIDNAQLGSNYDNELMELSLTSNLKEGQKIALQAILPISLDFTRDEILKQTDGQLSADMEISDIKLDEIAELIDYDIDGVLNLKLALRNSWDDMQLVGSLTLSDGRFSHPDLGMNYRDIQLEISTDEANNINIASQLKARRGRMDIDGLVRLEDMVSLDIDYLDITIKADNFQVLDEKNLRVSMDADILLEGTMENPRYSGTITLPNSRINLEAFDRFKQEEEIYQPILLREPTRTNVTAIPKAESPSISMPDIMENLRGTLSIYIPGNNWLRGLGTDLELGGEIDVVKTGIDFELFGTVRIIRGNYELYGRKFDLRGGTLTFTGGTEIDPLFDLAATHVFRDIEGKRQVLRLELSGTASDPVFQFYLGKESITEADAISYLIFRRNTQQLTQGEKAQLDEESDNMGMVGSLLLGEITDRLTSSLRRNLQLDVIEFSGDQNWRNATIIVGKYLSDRLYLNYERQIALKESQNLDPQRISLEYEINRYLFLQATSGDDRSTGFDLFWKTTFP